MRFAIHGIDRNTGLDVDRVIEAESRSEAATQAMARGIVVATLTVIDNGPDPLEPPPEPPHQKYPANDYDPFGPLWTMPRRLRLQLRETIVIGVCLGMMMCWAAVVLIALAIAIITVLVRGSLPF